MIRMYDRKGVAISDVIMWGKLLQNRAYQIVAQTTLPHNKRWISTVWLGLDHQCGVGPPLIFETMVFATEDDLSNVLDSARYSTEEDALKGHAAMCEQWGK